MFKMSFAVYRRPELTQEQFLHYWRTVHGPLAASLAKPLRLRRYVQLHGGDYEVTRMMTASRGCAPAHDGVCEIWWDSEADRLAAAATKEGQEASLILKADELRFCDMTRSTVVFGHEHVVVGDWTPAYVAGKEPVAAE